MFADIRTNHVITHASTKGYKNNGLTEFGAKVQAVLSLAAVIATAYGVYYVVCVMCK